MREPLDPGLFGDGQPCFGCAPDHPTGLRLRFEKGTAEDGSAFVETTWRPDDRFQGPPGIVHGGIVATLADEVAAWAVVALTGRFGFTTRFDGAIRRPLRPGRDVTGRGRITTQSRRTVDVAVRLEQDGLLAFEGAFSFALVTEVTAERLLGVPLPDAWKRFCAT